MTHLGGGVMLALFGSFLKNKDGIEVSLCCGAIAGSLFEKGLECHQKTPLMHDVLVLKLQLVHLVKKYI